MFSQKYYTINHGKKTGCQQTCKPGSVLNDHPSGTAVTNGLKRPTIAQPLSRRAGQARVRKLGLASDGVYPAAHVTMCAVVSYTALSPLPALRQAVCFLWHFPRVTPTGRYPASCPAKPGLSSGDKRPRSFGLLTSTQTLNKEPPTNSLQMLFIGSMELSTGMK